MTIPAMTGKCAALDHLGQVGGEEQAVHREHHAEERDAQPQRPFPQAPDHHAHQQGGDQHGSGHRHAVGSRQRRRGLEAEHQQDHADHQRPIHPADVDLPLLVAGSVLDGHPRHVAELDRLTGQGEGAGDHRLGGDHRGQGGQRHHRQQRPAGRQQVEGVARRLGVGKDGRALAEVVQHQRRQHQQEPGTGDRLATEVAHVGVQRLGAGQRQYGGAEDGDTDAGMRAEETHGPYRVHRLQHFRLLDHPVDTQRRQGAEPEHHDRAEQDADPRGAVLLDQEQADQHDKRQRYRPVLQAVEGDLQPFYRRQYRDRRGDHAVAVEQRRADQAGNHHEGLQPAERRRRPARQGRQRHHPALALVVGTQDEDHVLDGNDPDQRPEDQRQHAKDAIVVGLHPVAADEDLFQGIQGTGADIPIADSNRPDHQADGRAGMPLRRLLGTRRCITHETLSPGKIRQMLRPCRPRCKRRGHGLL